jgi:hypothetical protein
MKKTCGKCVCAIFKPLNICMAPMKIGDKRREYGIETETECFIPEHYAENAENARRRRRMEELEKLERQLGIGGKDDREHES